MTPLQKEEQILQFLKVNAAQLYPTLASPAFFPGKSWNEIISILQNMVALNTNNAIEPGIQKILSENMDLSFIQLIRQQNMPQDQLKKKIYEFVSSILSKQEARFEFVGSYNALAYRFVDKYLEEIFDRKQYTHFELTKVQRLKLGKDAVKDMIRLSILLKPAVFLLAESQGAGKIESGRGLVQAAFAEKALQVMKQKFVVLPDEVLASAVHANVSFQENPGLEATSRIASILTSMGKAYKPDQQIDRGADTADKSWLSIARKNFRYYGFDIKMIDECYMIAAENGW
ncbi:MAG: hypothetical protein JW760_05905 [Spirochaetales bacterium]|nr:hypothetical protein [Spirochaetales bacterium]